MSKPSSIRGLVLTVAFGYGLPEYRTFVLSLRRHYKGETIIISDAGAASEASQLCVAHNVTMLHVDMAPKLFRHTRFSRFAELCHLPEHYCLSIDFRDSFFQADPFSNIDLLGGRTERGMPPDLLLSQEGVATWPHSGYTLGERWMQKSWVEQCFGKETAAAMQAWPTICSGAVFGTAAGFAAFASAYSALGQLPHACDFQDQARARTHSRSAEIKRSPEITRAVLNYLVFRRLLHASMRVQPRGAGVVHTMAPYCGVTMFVKRGGARPYYCREPRPLPLSAAGLVVNDDGAVAPVVHQYDRVLNRSTSMSAVFEAVRHIELQSTSPSRPNRGRGRGAGHRRLGKSRPS
ncbi:hypothetical protein EMIHUDRAFT_446420 [Emiliania huxleyi CCMP1516]|nr:hypothetical protein EMIHUDRAFT_446420 [Emiliania huxleyi CCMP1516]EOD07578.1 hypothetical protein EMIHUDRAFT_446420 [Emiliania huxleyi CCMP1516]|eukprot:XP_005760007.1 hypothetical protein EMIHUDRAFT_446420 [Emiliania huxleyi CCMP1516]